MADNRKINLEWMPSAYRQAIDKSQPAESRTPNNDKPISNHKEVLHKGFRKSLKRKSFLGK